MTAQRATATTVDKTLADMTTIDTTTIDTEEPTMSDVLTFTVPGMTCGHCEAAVKQEVGTVDGVRAVDVDLQSKIVTVSGAALDRDAIVAAIDEAGYDVAG
jgi:copper chaperone